MTAIQPHDRRSAPDDVGWTPGDQVPLFRPVIDEDAAASVRSVLSSGWLGLGPKTAEFEERFAHYVGSPYCVALNSGTAALHLAVRLLDLRPGDEIITTALTFVSSSQVILQESGRPVWADVDPRTGNIDPVSVEVKISDRTRAILAVHYGGLPCDLSQLRELADVNGIPLIEDCAHASGATYRGERIGGGPGLKAFSFHAVKPLTTGEGGAITLTDQEQADRLRRLRWLGIDRSTYERAAEGSYAWEYEVTEPGFKYHMSDINAAIGLVQLDRLDSDNAKRAEIATRYRVNLSDVEDIRMLEAPPDRTSAHHLFVVLAERRDRLHRKLAEAGIATGVHYRRNDLYPLFERADLPATENFWRHALSLPMHLALTVDQVDFVCDQIAEGW